jgi:hypothetical protein
METTKALSPAPTKKVVEAVKDQAEAKAGSSVPIETMAAAPEDKAEQQTSYTGKAAGQDMIEKAKSPTPKALAKDVDYIIRHASGKKLSKEEILEARHYVQKLKYPKGGLNVQWHWRRWLPILSPGQQRNIRLPGESQKYGISEAWGRPFGHVEGWSCW